MRLKHFLAFMLRFFGKLAQVADLANFIMFMSGNNNTRRSLTETIIGVNLGKFDTNQKERSLSFEYVNILVVWTALGRSMSQLLPFLDFSKVKYLL
jgi:hypothetical protein